MRQLDVGPSLDTFLAWDVGDSWKIWVEAYATVPELGSVSRVQQNPEPSLLASYGMVVRVAGSVPHSNSVCWVLDFVPTKEAPAFIQDQKYRVLAAHDGTTLKVEAKTKETDPVSVETFGDIVFVPHMLSGFPIQLLRRTVTDSTVFEKRGQNRTLSVSGTDDGTEHSVEARLETTTHGGRKETNCLVRQKWLKGAKWWSSYESYVHGELHTRAWLLSAPTTNIGAADPKKP